MSAGRRRTGGGRARAARPATGSPAAVEGGPWSVARKAYTAIAALGVVIGVIAGALGLIDRLNGSPATAPAAIDPEIVSVATDTGSQPLGDYLRLTRQSGASFSAAQLAQPGYQFEVGMRIRGLLRKKLTLEWSMYRRTQGDVVRLHGRPTTRARPTPAPKPPITKPGGRAWAPARPRAGPFPGGFGLLATPA